MADGGLAKLTSQLLSSDKDFLYLGIALHQGEGAPLKFIKDNFNSTLMKDEQVANEDVAAANTKNSKSYNLSFSGDIVVQNASLSFKIPILGISMPYMKNEKGEVKSILVGYIKMDSILKAFKSAGITNVFMVNERGDLLAGPENSVIMSSLNYANNPIIKMMMKSKLDNGQTSYKDENSITHLGSFKKINIGGCGIVATV